jgi:hypothetical protein
MCNKSVLLHIINNIFLYKYKNNNNNNNNKFAFRRTNFIIYYNK